MAQCVSPGCHRTEALESDGKTETTFYFELLGHNEPGIEKKVVVLCENHVDTDNPHAEVTEELSKTPMTIIVDLLEAEYEANNDGGDDINLSQFTERDMVGGVGEVVKLVDLSEWTDRRIVADDGRCKRCNYDRADYSYHTEVEEDMLVCRNCGYNLS